MVDVHDETTIRTQTVIIDMSHVIMRRFISSVFNKRWRSSDGWLLFVMLFASVHLMLYREADARHTIQDCIWR